jgi:hypothetical protein
VHDYYGMIEQPGSIYMECDYGYLHTSIFPDIIIRKPYNFSIADKGIIQTISVLPKSYPEHSLLTEDGCVFRYVFHQKDVGKHGFCLYLFFCYLSIYLFY